MSNAIFDGTDAVMLSQETAVGRDPAAAVHMMSQIAIATERELPYWRMLTERGLRGGDDEAAIAFGAVGAVYQLGLKALVCPTLTGKTARLISSHRPQVPVLALSPRLDVVRRCQIYWGVHACSARSRSRRPELLEMCADAVKGAGFAEPGDKVGLTAGLPAGQSGGTNLFKVHTAGLKLQHASRRHSLEHAPASARSSCSNGHCARCAAITPYAEVLALVRRHHAGAQQRAAALDRRVERDVRVDAAVVERLPEQGGLPVVADEHRHDRRVERLAAASRAPVSTTS